MSRGGRGGGFARGGAINGEKQFGGLKYDESLEAAQDTKPSYTVEKRFPDIPPPIAEPPNTDEKRIVHHYRTLRARVHDGPFYTVLGDNVRISKTGKRSPPTAHFDPFEGQPTYAQRYKKKRYTLPKLSTRPFAKEHFPRELWFTIDPTDKTGVEKKLRISTLTRFDKYLANSELYGDDDPDRPTGDDIDADANEDDADKPADDDDADKDADEEKDEDADPDQFNEDDEDDDDDYNAENYFSGGEEDEVGDDGGGMGGDDE